MSENKNDPFAAFKNPDGKTYNGIKFIAAITGYSEHQIRQWHREALEKVENARSKD